MQNKKGRYGPMDSINAMFLIDLVIIVAGIYLLYLSLRMKKTKKVEKFVVAEETLKNCKDEKAFADYLWIRQLFFSIIMTITGVLMAIHETIFPFGYVYYAVVGVLAIAFVIYYIQWTDGRIKYC